MLEIIMLELLPLQGVSYPSNFPRAMPYAMCSLPLGFPFGRRPLRHSGRYFVIADNHLFELSIFKLKIRIQTP